MHPIFPMYTSLQPLHSNGCIIYIGLCVITMHYMLDRRFVLVAELEVDEELLRDDPCDPIGARGAIL